MSNPRIIAGKARGLRLNAVPGTGTRPITDRVKESLFNIIGTDIVDSTFLDLFGGTGSVGIEALSRGASFVRFLENSHTAFQTIRKNLELTRLEEHSEVILRDAFRYLFQPVDKKFDYIYIAPPQYRDLWKRSLVDLESNIQWLAESAWVIVQIDPKENQPITLKYLAEFDQRRYGSTQLIFYNLQQ